MMGSVPIATCKQCTCTLPRTVQSVRLVGLIKVDSRTAAGQAHHDPVNSTIVVSIGSNSGHFIYAFHLFIYIHLRVTSTILVDRAAHTVTVHVAINGRTEPDPCMNSFSQQQT